MEKLVLYLPLNLNFNYGFRKGGKNQRKYHPFFPTSTLPVEKRVMTCVDTTALVSTSKWCKWIVARMLERKKSRRDKLE